MNLKDLIIQGQKIVILSSFKLLLEIIALLFMNRKWINFFAKTLL
jgi:hypothetical protein